ncbi:hypothetical protein DB347_01235 [Opitutaceae bacterium EW11]|nr:hypothetical protein DB347_01235 [Opitutaceae bacterium EW11]
MRWLRLLLFAITAPCMAAATFLWTGGAGDGAYTNPANWSAGVVPPNDGSAVVIFGNAGAGVVRVSGLLNLAQIQFANTTSSAYTFSAGTSAAVVTLQKGFLSQDGSRATFTSDVFFNLTGSEAFEIGAGSLEIDGSIVGIGSLTKSGSGNLKLLGLNLWTGGVTHASGTITLGSFANLGIGTLRLAGGELALPAHDNVVVPNAVVIQANTRISGVQDQFAVFAGPVTLASSVTLTASGSSAIFITNAVQETGGARQLTVSGLAPVILSGPSSYTGGTVIDNGALIFASASSVPTTGSIKASTLGYVGIGYTNDVQSGVLSRIDNTNFLGIIGFDTSPIQGGTNVFDKTIDLTGLTNYASIGSRTSAVISGEVKVNQAQDYRFGGGGGSIYLESNLTARGANLQVVSPFGQPLTLVLRGNNTFSGSTNVLYSVLVLDRAGTIASSTPLNLTGPGYIGATENAGFTPNQFLGRLTKIASADAIAGFDSASMSAPRTISDPIDLSVGGRRTDPYYLGTSSRVTLTGTITPTVGDALYLTAVKGGRLVVQSKLGNNIPGVVVGQSNSFDPQGGTVELASANSYTGQTQVRGGTLLVSNSGALSTGIVSVADRASLSLADGVTLSNGLSLSSGARLSGTGTFSSPGGLTIDHGAIISPGGLYSVGTLQFGSGLTLGPGGILELDVRFNSSGFYGDRVVVSNGALNIAGAASGKFTVSLYSLGSDGALGYLTGFDPTKAYSWEFATAGNIVGFNSNLFTVDTSNFLSSTGSGSFFVSQNGNSLMINFTPVPEPSTLILYGIGLVAIAAFEFRRRRNRP